MATLLGRRRVGMYLGLAGAVGLLAGCGGSGGGSSRSASTVAPSTSGSTNKPGSLSLGTGRALHTATLLKSGDVFIAGGVDTTGKAIDQTAIVSPTSVKFGPRLLQARVGHTTTLLENGQVLIAGGQTDSKATAVLNTTELYDPLAGAITKGPALTQARSEAVAVSFGPAGSQQVLIAGGADGKAALDTAEVLDVKGGKFAALPVKLAEPVAGAGAARLDDGTIVIVGGDTANGPAGAEVFDPTKLTFAAVNVTVRRSGGAFAATGREAIVAGGASVTGVERSTETYDIATKLFSQGSLLIDARRDGTANVLSGAVVVIGGRNQKALNKVEVLKGMSLATSTVANVTTLSTARYGHTATVVNGKVLVIGGFDVSGTALASIESVDPFAAPAAPTGSTVGTPTTGTPGTGTGSGLPPAPGGSGSGGLGGILGSILGGLGGGSGSTGGSIIGKVATAGIQTILGQGFSGGIGGFLKAFAGNLIAQFFPPSSTIGGILGSILPPSSTTSSGSSGGLGGILGSILGGGSSTSGSSSSGIGGVIGSVLGSIFGGGSSSTPAPSGPTPTISSMTPSSGPVGSVVTITGDYLGTGGVSVDFKKKQGFFSKILGFITGSKGKTSASVNSVTAQSATTSVVSLTVPSDADTGDVTVTTASGASVSAGTFTVQ